MEPDNARKTILAIGVTLIIAGTITDIVSGKSRAFDSVPRRVVGVVIMSGILMALAGPMPQFAKALAWLIGVGYLFLSPGGIFVLNALGRIGSATTLSAPSEPSGPTAPTTSLPTTDASNTGTRYRSIAS